jgi:hypothetical protein
MSCRQKSDVDRREQPQCNECKWWVQPEPDDSRLLGLCRVYAESIKSILSY